LEVLLFVLNERAKKMKGTFEKSVMMVSILATVLAAAPANGELAGYWKFDETSGTTAHDSSGNGYHAAAVEGAPVWDPNGKYGGCLNLNGTYGMSIPVEAFGNVSEAVSISMWVNYHPNQPDSTTVLFQAGADVNQEHRFVISVRTEWKSDAVDFETGLEKHNSETWDNAKLRGRAGLWDHYVFVTDTKKSFQCIYHNGLPLGAGGTANAAMSGITKAHIGLATDRVHDQQRARIDDVRIYNHGLSAEEVRELHRFGPALLEVGGAVRQGEDILDKQGPQEAIAFIEGKVGEAERWGRQHPTEQTSSFNQLLFDLNFLLAKAKQEARLPRSEVEAAYRRASQQGRPSLWRCESVLQWLQNNGKTAEYERIVWSLHSKDLDDLMTNASEKAELMVDNQRQREAIDVLESRLAIYTTWKNKASGDTNTFAPTGLPDAYLHLARAKKAVGTPERDVAAAYSKAFGSSETDFGQLSFEEERAAALIWLSNKGFTDEFTQTVKSLSRAPQVSTNLARIIEPVCKDFESRKDWTGFEGFLDALFAAEKYPIRWGTFVESCLSNRKNRWAKGYFRYVDSKPELKFARDCALAQEHLSDEKFVEAAELYRRIINSCDNEDDKAFYQFQLCKSLFHASRPADVLPQLESFITNYGTSHPALARQAALMKGRLYLQSRRLDEALSEFRSAAADFAGTPQACEARFFASYCSMLQGGLDSAAEALNAVAEDCPESQWARKAGLCLVRIENTAANKTVAN